MTTPGALCIVRTHCELLGNRYDFWGNFVLMIAHEYRNQTTLCVCLTAHGLVTFYYDELEIIEQGVA